MLVGLSLLVGNGCAPGNGHKQLLSEVLKPSPKVLCSLFCPSP